MRQTIKSDGTEAVPLIKTNIEENAPPDWNARVALPGRLEPPFFAPKRVDPSPTRIGERTTPKIP
jgi:hypothetical protein